MSEPAGIPHDEASGDAFHPGGSPVGVQTAEAVDRPFDYLAPEGGCLDGALVSVPLGARKVLGVVWGPAGGDFDRARLRSVDRVLDTPRLPAAMRAFLDRAAAYTMTPRGLMVRLATRAPGLDEPLASRRLCRLGTARPARLTPARARVLDLPELCGGTLLLPAEVAARAGVSPSVVAGLIAAGALIEETAPRDRPFPRLDPGHTAAGTLRLTPEQAAAVADLRTAVAGGHYGTTLLQGVTGSGKTEVYLEAVAETLRQGRQALVLLPEIALTAEFLARVERRFGARPAEWHSGLAPAGRRRVWRMTGEGGAGLVVGARSALFLPFRDLGLIVVDEEHDTSYKQEEGVLYSARDMAVLRGAIGGAQVVLASATPSLETWVNAESGKYRRLRLSARFGDAELPEMRAIDMRTEKLPTNRFVSPALEAAVRARLGSGEQSLLFLNRRGYAPVTLCRACGQQIGCRHCDARMVEHRSLNRLVCHQCGETIPIPTVCPSCGVEGKLAALGPGVERLAEEVREKFPGARVAVLSSDLHGSARALKEQILAIADGAADIVIGTQLVAKGHNFPHLTLVGVVDADLGLQGSDMRAAERTFQLMRQVAGRAGRGSRPGLALLQTWQPDHPVIRAILGGDEEAFWRAEAAERRQAGVPPFGRLAGIILSGPDLEQVMDLGRTLARHAEPLRAIGAEVYGPASAPIARIRGRHRVRILVKAARTAPLQAALRAWVAGVRPPGKVRLAIDIDPQSFL